MLQRIFNTLTHPLALLAYLGLALIAMMGVVVLHPETITTTHTTTVQAPVGYVKEYLTSDWSNYTPQGNGDRCVSVKNPENYYLKSQQGSTENTVTRVLHQGPVTVTTVSELSTKGGVTVVKTTVTGTHGWCSTKFFPEEAVQGLFQGELEKEALKIETNYLKAGKE